MHELKMNMLLLL